MQTKIVLLVQIFKVTGFFLVAIMQILYSIVSLNVLLISSTSEGWKNFNFKPSSW